MIMSITMPNGRKWTDAQALEYLKDVFGYKRVSDVPEVWREAIRENAEEGFPLDVILCAMFDAEDEKGRHMVTLGGTTEPEARCLLRLGGHDEGDFVYEECEWGTRVYAMRSDDA